MAKHSPIFIHSLFRCASTYFFQKFRSAGSAFTCYQEPFNEYLESLNRTRKHARLLASPDDQRLRHPQLDRPYFYEFWVRREALRGLYRRAFAYDEYFTGASLPEPQRRWIGALLEQAAARPVLQFCRSSGRAAALRSTFDATHLHLWREPRAQWWSYKVSDYFDSVSQRIYAGRAVPQPLARLARGIGGQRYLPCPLMPEDNYALFYGLWLDAWLRLHPLADLSINIDQIATDPKENRARSAQLSELVEATIDLGDLRPSGMVFTREEIGFYEAAETRVAALFIESSRASPALVGAAERAAARARSAHAQRTHDDCAERNLRQMMLSMMQQRAGGASQRDRQGRRDLSGTLGWLARLRKLSQPRRPAWGSVTALGQPAEVRGNSALAPAVAPPGAHDGYRQA
jgi:hypothetical protein